MQQPATTYGDLIEPGPLQFSLSPAGWLTTGGLLLLLALCLVMLIHRYRQRNRYRKEAILLLQRWAKTASGDEQRQFLYKSAVLLKSVAMYKYGHDPVATLRGNDYVQFLNSKWKERTFTQSDGDVLGEYLYMKDFSITAFRQRQLTEKMIRWIRKHTNAN